MKNYLLPAVALFAAQGLYAQIDNGSFDHWVEKEMFQQPAMGVETMSSNYETFFADGSLNVTAVDGPDGKAMRLESIAVGGEAVPGFFITGTVPDQEGEGLVFGGGVPVTDPNVTGVTFSIRHDIDPESPGFVVLQFKADGVPVGEGNMGPGTMMVPLQGASDWHEVNIEFEGVFEQTPTECVFAIATNNLLGDDQTFPAGSFAEIDNLNFISSSEWAEDIDFADSSEPSPFAIAQQFPGGNFENWTDVAPVYTPEGVLAEFDPFQARFERTEDANSGMYALALKTVGGAEWSETSKAVFAEGEIENPVPYIEINESHHSFSFAYKFEAADDKAAAVIRFFSQSGEGEFNQVFEKEFILEPVDVYTDVNYDFRQDVDFHEVMEELMAHRGSIGEATHITVEFKSGVWSEDNTPSAGSVLKVDDVALSGSLRSSSVTVKPPAVTAFPNPTTHRVQFEFNLPRSGYFRVFNLAGAQVDVKQFSSTKFIMYDLSHLRSGGYIFRFQHNAGADAVRVIKE